MKLPPMVRPARLRRNGAGPYGRRGESREFEASVSGALRSEAMDAPPLSRRTTPPRSAADLRMRRILRIPDDGARASARSAENAFSTSVFISAVRCLLTYLLLPVLGPVVGLAGQRRSHVGTGGGHVSCVAIVASMRRFFRADHRWRWRYTTIGGTILVFLVVQAVIDIAALAR